MKGSTLVLVVLALLQSTVLVSTELRCGSNVRPGQTINSTGVTYCYSTAFQCSNCIYYSSVYLANKYPGLFYIPGKPNLNKIPVDQDLPDDGDEDGHIQRRAVNVKSDGKGCCETDRKMKTHPLVAKNSEGQLVSLLAFGSYRQGAFYGNCVDPYSTCMTTKKCMQEYTWHQVLVWKRYWNWYWYWYISSLPFTFDWIQITVSCICVG